MNKVILMGRLTRDPEMKKARDTSVVKFSLAVDRRFKKDGQPDADFINCVVFGKTAEFTNNYFSKGMRVAVTGRLQTSSWEDESKKKHYGTDVIVEEAYFADSKGAKTPTNNVGDNVGDIIVDDDDELPF